MVIPWYNSKIIFFYLEALKMLLKKKMMCTH